MKITLEILYQNEYSEKTMLNADAVLDMISIDIFYE